MKKPIFRLNDEDEIEPSESSSLPKPTGESRLSDEPAAADIVVRREAKEGERLHPTDPYPKLRRTWRESRVLAFLKWSFVWTVLVALIVGVILIALGPGRFAAQGYEVVRLQRADAIISAAPDRPTYYIGRLVNYNAPRTDTPIAILAGRITVEGHFHDEVSLTAMRVTTKEGAEFSKEVEIWTLALRNLGAVFSERLRGFQLMEPE